MTTYDNREREFRTKLEALLSEYAEVVGPVYVDEDGAPIPDQPLNRDELALNEWMLAHTWMDMATGDLYIRGMTMAGMPQHHQMGLLYKFIDIVEDRD